MIWKWVKSLFRPKKPVVYQLWAQGNFEAVVMAEVPPFLVHPDVWYSTNGVGWTKPMKCCFCGESPKAGDSWYWEVVDRVERQGHSACFGKVRK